MTKYCLLATVMAACGLVFATLPARAVAPASAGQVKDALRLLGYVQDDMARKIPGKNYARLPHENQEFQEAAPALRDAIKAEPETFKASVEARLAKAQAAARRVAEISSSNDDGRIVAAVQAVADALRALNGLFPPELRPVPGQLGVGAGRASGGPAVDPR